MTLPAVTLVLGGASSGKSAYAEALAEESGRRMVYVATAEAFDDEMHARIEAHRARRADGWETVEAPLDLAAAVAAADAPDAVVLVDCLTLWLGNLMADERRIGAEVQALADALDAVKGRVVLVSNELGLGIVPDNRLARSFRELHGTLNQCVAGIAQRVVFVAAGLPLTLKDEAP